MTRLPPNTFATFCKGLDQPTLSDVFTRAGLPAAAEGTSSGWAWLTHQGVTGGDVLRLARDLTGYRYVDLAGGPDRVETVFLASTPACACPHGQNYLVPHCPEHPFQVSHSRGGFEQLYLNMGGRRESRRGGGRSDHLLPELLAAGIVGRDTARYDADPDFNADGAHTRRIVAEHFGLPAELRP